MALRLLPRTRDGRSIGLALAVLLALNAFLVGIASGVAAPIGPELAFCGLDHQGSPELPGVPGHEHDCCVPAMAAAPLATPPALVPPAPIETGDLLPAATPLVVAAAQLLSREPRGPPLA